MGKRLREKRPKLPKEKKAKSVSITPAEREHAGKMTEPYRVMDRLIDKHHKQLLESEARIAIAWDEGPAKQDVDGMVKFGRVKRGGDLDRAYAEYDFWLIIRRELWNTMDAKQREARIDSLLCRCAVQRDSNGEVVIDEKGRSVFRLRKPVEVFPENVARYGFHQEPKLEDMLKRFNDSNRPLLNQEKKPAGPRFNEPAMGKPSAEANGNGHGNGKSKGRSKSKGGDPPTEGDTEVTKSLTEIPISDLDLAFPIPELLEAADLHSLADLMRYEEEHGQIGLAQIKDMGTVRADDVRDAVAAYREKHPELFEAAGV